MNINILLQKLVNKEHLSYKEAYDLLLTMMRSEMTQLQMSSFLTALTMKGETQEEIHGFIQAMRDQMISIILPNAIDVCGTGGDGKNAFNISTAVAFVVAGAGVTVAKHGNRAASSNCGSADVLEELGVKLDITIEKTQQIFHKSGIVFLFAPLFHKSMKNVSQVRKDLKIRTIFNYLGPFTNPAKVTRQLICVSDNTIAAILSQVAKALPYEHIIIAATDDGFDEVSLTTKTYLYEIKNNNVIKYIISPEDFGFAYASYKDLIGGDAKTNATIIQAILQGKKGPKRDIVLLNSGVALYVAGKTNTIREGIQLAQKSVDSGKANEILTKLKSLTNQ